MEKQMSLWLICWVCKWVPLYIEENRLWILEMGAM